MCNFRRQCVGDLQGDQPAGESATGRWSDLVSPACGRVRRQVYRGARGPLEFARGDWQPDTRWQIAESELRFRTGSGRGRVGRYRPNRWLLEIPSLNGRTCWSSGAPVHEVPRSQRNQHNQANDAALHGRHPWRTKRSFRSASDILRRVWSSTCRKPAVDSVRSMCCDCYDCVIRPVIFRGSSWSGIGRLCDNHRSQFE